MRSMDGSTGLAPQAPESSARRLFQRKIRELASGDGSKDMSKTRSMAIELLDRMMLVGVLKSVNDAAGCGFLECLEAEALFSRELPVNLALCKGVPVGEQVSFRVQTTSGQPIVYDVAFPPVPIAHDMEPPQATDEPSGMAAVLAHNEGQKGPVWSDAALTWKQKKEADERRGMDSLLAGADGPGRSSSEWKPSLEADTRKGIAAVMAHKQYPERYPVPQVRQTGSFLGWKSN
mmetsp:Transcript_58909/g.164585  ORF Transcript_58909/g.164585 Transcript_58909/m.164585 type:complete len:233 (+) Transcript_58909:59-757(+)